MPTQPAKPPADDDSLTDLVSVAEDHVVIIDISPAESVRIKVESIGRPFRAIERTAVVV